MSFLRQVFGAEPVGGVNGVAGLGYEAADFIGHILLCGVESVVRSGIQILLGGADVGIGAGLGA